MAKKRRTKKQKEQAAKREEKRAEAQPIEEKEQTGETNIVKEIIEMVIYFAVVIVVVWFVLTYVGQRTVVIGSSMYDTLEDGESLWVSKLSYRLHDPERFDIVVFPHDEGDGTTTLYIKRIIGMPGETIRIDEDGVIYINNEPLEEEYGYEVINESMIGRACEDVVLDEDEYFVMGDNRNNSQDSRFEIVGNIERDELVGKAVFCIWPFSKFGTIK